MSKKTGHKSKTAGRKDEKEPSINGKVAVFLLPFSVFILSFICFYFFFSYIFFYQENQTLFIFSCDYFSQFVSKPGGLLEYAGNFIAQGYFSKLYGALIIAALFTLIAMVYHKIASSIIKEWSMPLLLAVLVSSFLVLIQTNINYLTHNNLGFLLTGMYFLYTIISDQKSNRILVLVLYPIFYYLTGAYALVYLGMYICYRLFRKEFPDLLIMVAIAGLSLLVFKSFISLQPWHDLFYYPLPSKDYFIHPWLLWLFILFFLIYPALLYYARSIKLRNEFTLVFPLVSGGIVILLTVFMLSRIYSRENVTLFNIEKLFFAADWNGVIRLQEKYQLRNPVAQYYYNIALSEKGLLCERMFFAPQDYGTMSISIPWNSQISITKMFRGVYFYYSIGLINEAHRWAFESMVIQGFHPENIKLLIKTNLINGHYKIAAKYIHILKKTLHYRRLAEKYEKMLSDPDLIKADPELGLKIKLKPNDDFAIRIRNPKMNIISLSESNPYNRKAFEYKMAWKMLEKNVEDVVGDLGSLADLNYSRIPRHIEEALLIYRVIYGQFSDLNLIPVSIETEARFSRYRTTVVPLAGKKSPAEMSIPRELRNTYWYYLDYK